jgi:hypothetical protein
MSCPTNGALSVPTTKMSSRFGAQATTRGEHFETPLRDSQPPQLAGSSPGKTLSVPVRFTGIPAGKYRCSSAAKRVKASDEPVSFWSCCRVLQPASTMPRG